MTDRSGPHDAHLPPPWLLGRWRLAHAAAEIGMLPGTRMEFLAGGTLRYTLLVEGTEQVVLLLYRTEGDLLRTENPPAGHATATPFRHGPGDTLVLEFAGEPAVLLREWPDGSGTSGSARH